MDTPQRACKSKGTGMLPIISTIMDAAICYEDVIIQNTRTGTIS